MQTPNLDFTLLLGNRFLKVESDPREFIQFTTKNELWHNFEGEPTKKCLYAPDKEYFSISWGLGAVYDCYPNPEMTRFTEHASKGEMHKWVLWVDEKLSDQGSSS